MKPGAATLQADPRPMSGSALVLDRIEALVSYSNGLRAKLEDTADKFIIPYASADGADKIKPLSNYSQYFTHVLGLLEEIDRNLKSMYDIVEHLDA